MERNPESVRNSQQRTQAGIAPFTLDIGDVAAREIAMLRQRLLGPTFAFSGGGNAFREPPPDFGFGLRFHVRVPNQVK